MLRFKTLKWAHAFSYGPDNSIDLSKADLIQLIGKNGHGKSSIALILEEVLFNKNSKGIKKGNILNRYSRAKQYTISIEFSKDSDNYLVETIRGSTQTVKLLCNGKDISAHTATATYKILEGILGFDHKAFTQIIYQSNAFSLEFLTATDTNRKKFLIELLRLTKYSKALDYYKELAKELSATAGVLSSKKNIFSSVVNKYSTEDLQVKPLVTVPIIDRSIEEEHTAIQEQLRNIDKLNSAITQNNKYKEILDSIEILDAAENPGDLTPLKIRQSELTKELASLSTTANGKIISVCPSCKQNIDTSHKLSIAENAKNRINAMQTELENVKAMLVRATFLEKEYTKALNSKLEWEKYYSLYDKSMSSIPLEKSTLEARSKLLSTKNREERLRYDIAIQNNVEITKHNAKVEVIASQLDSAKIELESINMQLEELNGRLANIQVLVKTFGTNGLVAYKIECLVKDLEVLTNKYLQDMSDGRFQLGFVISSSDKLDVIITDNGSDIDINALSNGELARVNISTLLAIRTLMQSYNSAKVNLLILDETAEHLDVDGKEKLVEVLLKEDSLNTVLVSHGFNHPLLEKVNIIKTNNISRIE